MAADVATEGRSPHDGRGLACRGRGLLPPSVAALPLVSAWMAWSPVARAAASDSTEAAAPAPAGSQGSQTEPAPEAPSKEKTTWSVGGVDELHRIFSTEVGSPVTVNDFLLRAGVSVAGHDEVAVIAGFTTAAIPGGETGTRFGDMILAYQHRFDLPARFTLTTGASVTAPTSLLAQSASNVTAPAAVVSLARTSGDLAAYVSGFGRYYIDRYAVTGDPALSVSYVNVKTGVGGSLGADLAMPFHRALSVGVMGLVVSWSYYSPGGPPPGSMFTGAVSDPQFQSPPSFVDVGLDVHVRYQLILGDARLAVVVGSGTGSTWSARANAGVPHVYALDGTNARDVYCALDFAYGP